MFINVHNLEPVSNFIAKSDNRPPVLCLEVAPADGGSLTLYFRSEDELNEIIKLMFKGRKLLRKAIKEDERGAE